MFMIKEERNLSKDFWDKRKKMKYYCERQAEY